VRLVPISLFLVLTFISVACNLNREHSSAGDQVGSEADSIAYARLLAGFEEEFVAIESEYDSTDAERQAELDIIYEDTELELAEAQKQFIRDYPKSMRSLMLLYEIDWSFKRAADFREYLEILDTSLYKSAYYQPLVELVDQMDLVEPDRQAPDFEMTDTQGTGRKLSEQYIHTKYLLLDFWASTCGPCRKENANIVKAYEMFHDKGFDVLGVSTDTRRDSWINAIALDELNWTNLCSLEPWNENEVVKLYALRQTSQNYLLDSSGKIIAKDIRGAELISTLEQLLP
jgi:peroxiredoxin